MVIIMVGVVAVVVVMVVVVLVVDQPNGGKCKISHGFLKTFQLSRKIHG